MLRTTVLEGTHENKFQGDVLIGFTMTVFGGFAITFFPHELHFSPGFFSKFSEGPGHPPEQATKFERMNDF